jgi:hypothetical protein
MCLYGTIWLKILENSLSNNNNNNNNPSSNLIENEEDKGNAIQNRTNITINQQDLEQYNQTALRIPIIDERKSFITYLDPNGKKVNQKILPVFVDLKLKTCKNQELTNMVQSSVINEKDVMFLNYKDSNNKFIIKYPNGWTQELYGNQIRFNSPTDHSYDIYIESIFVDVQQAYETSTLDEYVMQTIEYLKNSVSDFKLIESTSSNLGGYPSQKISYTYYDPNIKDSKAFRELAIINDKIFIITYLAHDTNFDANVDIAEEMIRSFTIL